MNKSIITLVALAAMLVASSCGSKHPGYRKAESGLFYKFHRQDKSGEKILPGDEVTVSLRMYTEDTVFLSTGRDSLLSDKILVEEPVYPGDLFEAIQMMAVGDSATFILNSTRLFLEFFRMQELPGYIRDSAAVFLDLMVRERLPAVEVQKKMQAMAEAQERMLEDLRASEPDRIAAFLKSGGYSAKPMASGLYYIQTRPGKGPQIRTGSAVTVNYVARLTDGKIIETSIREEAIKNGTFDSLFEYTPFTFIMGDSSTVAGWEQGISMMRKGGKAVLIVPSSLAYGEEGLEDLVPPYAPLVYEIEVVEVK
jgi:FKBP-type peptidyl-prolyl cis-trans isomerase